MSQNTGILSVKKEWSQDQCRRYSGDRLDYVNRCLLYILPRVQDVFLALTFLQEKLTNTPVSIAPKTHYNNLFRSVTLFEQKVPSAEPSEA